MANSNLPPGVNYALTENDDGTGRIVYHQPVTGTVMISNADGTNAIPLAQYNEQQQNTAPADDKPSKKGAGTSNRSRQRTKPTSPSDISKDFGYSEAETTRLFYEDYEQYIQSVRDWFASQPVITSLADLAQYAEGNPIGQEAALVLWLESFLPDIHVEEFMSRFPSTSWFEEDAEAVAKVFNTAKENNIIRFLGEPYSRSGSGITLAKQQSDNWQQDNNSDENPYTRSLLPPEFEDRINIVYQNLPSNFATDRWEQMTIDEKFAYLESVRDRIPKQVQESQGRTVWTQPNPSYMELLRITRAGYMWEASEIVGVDPGLLAALVQNEIRFFGPEDNFNDITWVRFHTFGISQVDVRNIRSWLEGSTYDFAYQDLEDSYPSDMVNDDGTYYEYAIGYHLHNNDEFAIRSAAVMIRDTRSTIETSLSTLGLVISDEPIEGQVTMTPTQIDLLTIAAYRSDWNNWGGPDGTLQNNTGPANVKDRLMDIYLSNEKNPEDRRHVMNVLTAADLIIEESYGISLDNLQELQNESKYEEQDLYN